MKLRNTREERHKQGLRRPRIVPTQRDERAVGMAARFGDIISHAWTGESIQGGRLSPVVGCNGDPSGHPLLPALASPAVRVPLKAATHDSFDSTSRPNRSPAGARALKGGKHPNWRIFHWESGGAFLLLTATHVDLSGEICRPDPGATRKGEESSSGERLNSARELGSSYQRKIRRRSCQS